jgi:hypothetical protein
VSRRLIIRPGAIGDFIVSLPAIHHLRTSFSEVWTTEANLPLVPAGFGRRTIISAGLDRVGVLPADDVLERLRGFDSVISWYGTNRPEFRKLADFTFFPALPPSGCGMHAVDYYCSQVGAPLGAIPSIEMVRAEPHGQIVVHPFASNEAKRWPGLLSLDLPNRVRIRGPEERLDGALFFPGLLELARFLSGARAYVGNDSGITHLAAALGVPTVALFGPTDPAVWGPRGREVRILRAPHSAEAIIDALHDFGI